ncbi:CTD kinase subunit gamma [Monosporozyma servazzii]
MDSLEARLRFITVLKTLQKTINVINISEITSSTTAIPTHAQASSDTPFVSVSHNGSLSSTSNTPSSSAANSNTFTLPQTIDSKYENPIEFYLKNYKEHYEDFHQCLIDTMKKFNVLDRLPITIYYFKLIYVLQYEINNETSFKILNEFMIPSLIEILTMILPENDIMSLTNLPLCEDLLNCLLNDTRIVTLIPLDLQTQLQDMIKQRNIFKQTILTNYETTQIINNERGTAFVEAPTILNRMEMDRDRHKRFKETNWKVKRPSNSTTATSSSVHRSMLNTVEFKAQWSTLNALTAEDIQDAKTLSSMARESYLL